MAARFWRWVLPCNLAFSTALTATLTRRVSLSMGTVLLIAIGILLCIHIECVLLGRALLEMSSAPWRRPLTVAPPSTGCMRPVLLIHGILCNGAVWRPWFERLRAAGFGPLNAVDLDGSRTKCGHRRRPGSRARGPGPREPARLPPLDRLRDRGAVTGLNSWPRVKLMAAIDNLEQLLARKDALEYRIAAAPALAQRLYELRSWQARRLARTYEDLGREPKHAPAVAFF